MWQSEIPLLIWSFNLCFSVAEENSCSGSSDSPWLNRDQNAQTPAMMQSPHPNSNAVREPKKIRPEDGYMLAYTLPTAQPPPHHVPSQQQQQQQHQAALDYKYKPHNSVPLLANSDVNDCTVSLY